MRQYTNANQIWQAAKFEDSSKLKTNFFILVVNKKPRSIQLTALGLDLEHLQQNLVKPADMLR